MTTGSEDVSERSRLLEYPALDEKELIELAQIMELMTAEYSYASVWQEQRLKAVRQGTLADFSLPLIDYYRIVAEKINSNTGNKILKEFENNRIRQLLIRQVVNLQQQQRFGAEEEELAKLKQAQEMLLDSVSNIIVSESERFVHIFEEDLEEVVQQVIDLILTKTNLLRSLGLDKNPIFEGSLQKSEGLAINTHYENLWLHIVTRAKNTLLGSQIKKYDTQKGSCVVAVVDTLRNFMLSTGFRGNEPARIDLTMPQFFRICDEWRGGNHSIDIQNLGQTEVDSLQAFLRDRIMEESNLLELELEALMDVVDLEFLKDYLSLSNITASDESEVSGLEDFDRSIYEEVLRAILVGDIPYKVAGLTSGHFKALSLKYPTGEEAKYLDPDYTQIAKEMRVSSSRVSQLLTYQVISKLRFFLQNPGKVVEAVTGVPAERLFKEVAQEYLAAISDCFEYEDSGHEALPDARVAVRSLPSIFEVFEKKYPLLAKIPSVSNYQNNWDKLKEVQKHVDAINLKIRHSGKCGGRSIWKLFDLLQ